MPGYTDFGMDTPDDTRNCENYNRCSDMSELILRFEKPQQVLKMSKPQLTLRFPKCFSATPADFKAYFDSLDSYTDDAAARTAGLTTHDLYWFAELTDTGIYDVLKRVSPL